MFLKEHISFKIFLTFLIGVSILLVTSCSTYEPFSSDSGSNSGEQVLSNALNIPAFIQDPQRIRSIELFRERPGIQPVIVLNSNETLTLRFDELASETRMFRVGITHHNFDWSESNVIETIYLRGFNEDLITGGTPSIISDPDFFSYQYQFPNRDFGVRVSGNYMLHISDYNTNQLLFSVPFIVHEDRGSLSAGYDEVFVRSNFPNHKIWSAYRFPDFVGIPQSDIIPVFVQNQFWGRKVVPSEIDVSEPGVVRYNLTRDQSFFGRYEFRPLLLHDLYSISRDVLEVFPDERPPRVRLQFDVVDLDINPRLLRSHRFGEPLADRGARYVMVEFNLQRPGFIDSDAEVYVVGPFNNWQVRKTHQMEYKPDTDSFNINELVKQGRYDYKYVVVEDGVVNDLALDAFFADSRQFYQVLMYYHDRQLGIDRILQFVNFSSR